MKFMTTSRSSDSVHSLPAPSPLRSGIRGGSPSQRRARPGLAPGSLFTATGVDRQRHLLLYGSYSWLFYYQGGWLPVLWGRSVQTACYLGGLIFGRSGYNFILLELDTVQDVLNHRGEVGIERLSDKAFDNIETLIIVGNDEVAFQADVIRVYGNQ